jgi:hypothetical protein
VNYGFELAMIAVEVQPGCRGRWRVLSHAAAAYAAGQQMSGWMLVYSRREKDNAWRTTKVDNMSAVAELVRVMRDRQAKLDAPGVIEDCELAGIWLQPVGDSLKVRGTLTDELRESLKRNKEEILRILAARPAWDDAEAKTLTDKAAAAGADAERQLSKPPKDIFTEAAKTILGDALGAIQRAKSCGRLDALRARVDWLIGWAGTLDKQLLRLREPLEGERAEAYAVRAAAKAAEGAKHESPMHNR